MSTLRGRLFAAILTTVLVAVAVSLGIGIALTRGAVRSSLSDQLSHEADLLATAATSAQRPAAGISFLQALPPPGAPAEGGVAVAPGRTLEGGRSAKRDQTFQLPVPPVPPPAAGSAVGGEHPVPQVLS